MSSRNGGQSSFIRAFLHADRLDALVAFENLNLQHLQAQPEHLHRNHLVFLLFLVGTMKELAEALNALRAALAKAKLLDPTEWTKLLGTWDARWRNDPVVSKVRNAAAFHIDRAFIDAGLDTLPKAKPVEIFRGKDPSSYPMARFHSAHPPSSEVSGSPSPS